MSGDDRFLARWSRRKRSSAARKRTPARPQPAAVATDGIAPNTPTASVARDARAAIAEPPPLPPIESLDPASDITRFLAPGVPAALTRQALRHAWQTDPVIRDFVGLSENAWDFNAPGGVPGFGPLTPADIRRLLDATGTPEAAAPPAEPSGPAAEPPPAPAGNAIAAAKNSPDTPVVTTQSEPDQEKPRAPLPGRRHGSALPR